MTDVSDLTPRQISVASLVAKGKSDKVIAAELGISDRRVREHITNLAQICGLDPESNTRIQIALWYRERVPITIRDVA